jgi:hypothetical protein
MLQILIGIGRQGGEKEAKAAKRREVKAIKTGKSKKGTIFSYKKFMRPEKNGKTRDRAEAEDGRCCPP